MAGEEIRQDGNYKGDDTVGKLMHDFGCKEAKDMYYPELAKGVRHFKEERGRKIMCEAVAKYAKSYSEKYAEQACADIGMSLSTAINIYLKKLGREKRIPFNIIKIV